MSNSDRFTDTGPTSAYYQGVNAERERIVELIRATYADDNFNELGSFVFSDDIVQLILKTGK